MFTIREIQKITEKSEISGAIDKNITIAYATKQERQNWIATSDDDEIKEISAALEIQRTWRGYRTRILLFDLLRPDLSILSSGARSTLPSELSGVPVTKLSSTRLKSASSSSGAQSKLEIQFQRYSDESISRDELPLPFKEFCACLIQHWWRKERKKLIPIVFPIASDDKSSIQLSTISVNSKDSQKFSPKIATSKGKLATDDALKLINKEDKAAALIQRAWRKHIDVQVYKYYRDLINFRVKGDPAMMLKCINPRESELLDSAAGIHIRFRLGGHQFPPTIYYKIYTHRSIADIGAFAPRDYTQAVSKALPGKYVHNKGISLKEYLEDNKSEWYKRWENNGWRPVSDKVLKHLYQDSITYESSKKKIIFNHSKLIRRQDVEKKKKQKKVDWMKKMYREGMLKAKNGHDSHITNLVESAAQGMLQAAEQKGYDAIEEWEVDELLEWSNGLNFDEYLNEWSEKGTTGSSRQLINNLKITTNDPFSIML